MKVLHITTDDSGGAGLCCLRLHQSMLELGIESRVVTLHNKKKVQEEYEYGGFIDKISKIPSKILRMFGLSITDRNKVMKLCIQNGTAYSIPCSSVNFLTYKWTKWADVIHLHWVSNYLDYPSFFKKINKPVVWTLHDENFFFGIAHYSDTLLVNHPLEIKYAKIKSESISYAENLSIVMLSEYFYHKFKDHKLLKGRTVKVINNSIDANLFKPIDKDIARTKLGLTKEDILIGFTAFSITDKRKGLDVLSHTVEKFGMSHMKILAIGTNPDNIVYPNVISIGACTNPESISEVLSAADFFAMPSYQEAFAQSPMEALACGLPIVVFPVSGTSELVNEQNGVICDDFTSDALKKGIEILMSRQYDPMKIRQDVIKRFSPGFIAEQYIKLYKTIM